LIELQFSVTLAENTVGHFGNVFQPISWIVGYWRKKSWRTFSGRWSSLTDWESL